MSVKKAGLVEKLNTPQKFRLRPLHALPSPLPRGTAITRGFLTLAVRIGDGLVPDKILCILRPILSKMSRSGAMKIQR
jgi:hypothetical protein